MSTGLENYDGWKADDRSPVEQPADPHEQCERDIARLEAEVEVEAAKHAQRPLTVAELHALVGALLPGQSYILDVSVHHSVSVYGPTRDTVLWRCAYDFGRTDGTHCAQAEAPTAGELYAKLRAALPPSPLDDVGDLPW